jgi:hypothetical protein
LRKNRDKCERKEEKNGKEHKPLNGIPKNKSIGRAPSKVNELGYCQVHHIHSSLSFARFVVCFSLPLDDKESRVQKSKSSLGNKQKKKNSEKLIAFRDLRVCEIRFSVLKSVICFLFVRRNCAEIQDSFVVGALTLIFFLSFLPADNASLLTKKLIKLLLKLPQKESLISTQIHFNFLHSKQQIELIAIN